MSTKASTSTKQTSEQDLENQQEEPQSAAEAEEQTQDNAEDGTESAGSGASASSGASYQSAVTGVNTRPQQSSQERVATGGAGKQDSEESSVCSGGSGTESQQGSAARQLSEDSTASTGFAVDALQLHGAVGGTSSRDSKSSASVYSTCLGDSQETALVCDSSSRTSLESGVAGGVSNSPDTQESTEIGTEAIEGVAPSGADGRSTRRSRVEFRESVDESVLEAEELEASSDLCLSKCACICDYLRPFSRRIRNSKFFMVFKMILFIIPISAFCMGLKYANHCPLGNELPILVMLSGVSGVVLLATCLALTLRSVVCPGFDTKYFRALMISSGLMLILVFAAGMESTYKMAPSSDPSSPDYCDIVFYYYAYYTNFVVIGIAILSFFIYVPSFNENEDYEHL